jgi:hypothetical protein
MFRRLWDARRRTGLSDQSKCAVGVPPHAAVVNVAFARLAKSLHLTGIKHHVLRHTGASVMVATATGTTDGKPDTDEGEKS